jgi:hypothetical protein
MLLYCAPIGGLGFGGQFDGEAAAAVDASDVKLDV